jgi:hypothetical protein
MKEALTKALGSRAKDTTADAGESAVDRILAAAFFRTRPLQAGTQATVINLNDRSRPASPRR